MTSLKRIRLMDSDAVKAMNRAAGGHTIVTSPKGKVERRRRKVTQK